MHGDEDSRETIASIEALRKRVPSIVKALNAEPALALRAAANPLLALQELGYRISDALQREVALRVRFDEPTRQRLAALTADIHRLAGEPFDIDSPAALGDLLHGRLGLPRVPPSAQLPPSRDPLDIAFRRPGGKRLPDPLAALSGAHAIIAPLLEYRAIQAEVPPLASPAVYAALKDGKTGPIRLRVRATLQRGATPE